MPYSSSARWSRYPVRTLLPNCTAVACPDLQQRNDSKETATTVHAQQLSKVVRTGFRTWWGLTRGAPDSRGRRAGFRRSSRRGSPPVPGGHIPGEEAAAVELLRPEPALAEFRSGAAGKVKALETVSLPLKQEVSSREHSAWPACSAGAAGLNTGIIG